MSLQIRNDSFCSGEGFCQGVMLSSSEIILGLGSASERRRYFVTSSLIGLAHTVNDQWSYVARFFIVKEMIDDLCSPHWSWISHYNDVIMTTMASKTTSLTVVYSTVYSDADQRKHQSSASLAFVWGIHRDRWIPRTKGQLRGKCFHLMTSSCVDIRVHRK